MKCTICGASGLGMGAVPLQRVDRVLYCKKCLPVAKGDFQCSKCGRKPWVTNDYFVTIDGSMHCETCESKLQRTAPAATAAVGGAAMVGAGGNAAAGMVEPFIGGLKAALDEALAPGEQVLFAINGSAGEGLVGTSRRVIVIKAGLSVGGPPKFRGFLYNTITGVDVSASLVYGRIQISAPGTVETSDKDINAAKAADNAVTFLATARAKFDDAAKIINSRMGMSKSA